MDLFERLRHVDLNTKEKFARQWWLKGAVGSGWKATILLVVVTGALVVAGVIVGLRPQKQRKYSDHLLEGLKGPMKFDDPVLIEYIRNEVLIPPSTRPYNLSGVSELSLQLMDPSEHFYDKELRKLFLGKKDLFFIEAGALDGEVMSNTLRLERDQGWTGLLVEADSTAFSGLRSKNRKAWSANVCLSPNSYPSEEYLLSGSHYLGPSMQTVGFKTHAMHGLAEFASKQSLSNSWFNKVLCLPLPSLLLALQVKKVDLLVLDVEGAEMSIIDSIDFKALQIEVLCIEWKKYWELPTIVKRLKSRGFLPYAAKSEDLILVRRGSSYAKLVDKARVEAIKKEFVRIVS